MKNILRPIKRTFARLLGLRHLLWRDALTDEVRFWNRYLSTGGLAWKEEYRDRLDPALPLQERVRSLITPLPNQPVRILDVGAGPLTILGKVWAGHSVELIAVDPLARQYDEVLANQKLTPPVRTQECRAEDLSAKFGENGFDLSYARNCLDHSEDPVRAIEQLLAVTKRGGCILLEHWPDEGESEAYHGLHQWNFRCENSSLIIWNRTSRIDMATHLSAQALLDCRLENFENKPMVITTIRKNSVT